MSTPTPDLDKHLLNEAIATANESLKISEASCEVEDEGFQPLQFEDAVDFLYTFDRSLREGRKQLHPWQAETLIFLSNRLQNKYTVELPLVFNLLACNGSGKDAFVIAGFAVFVLCCWKRYKIVITSSSDEQLKDQTRQYITDLCNEVNSVLRQEWGVPDVINVKVETFKSKTFIQPNGKRLTLTGSEIITFVTKEGGKAEGHHPYPDADPGQGVILIANEAKTIPQEIFDHFGKCTYNIFLKVSSAGAAKQHFANSYKSARDWQEGYIPGVPFRRKITYKDCPHLPDSRMELEKKEHGGEDSPWFRMSRKSEFVNVGEEAVVIENWKLDICISGPKEEIKIETKPRAGLDLGAGGDPSAFRVWKNNKCIGWHRWSYKDTQLTVDLLCGGHDQIGLFNQYGLEPDRIIGDDNGVGQAIIDGIYRREVVKGSGKYWEIVRNRAQFAATNKIKYLNRGAEWWFRYLRLVEESILDYGKHMSDDLYSQLTQRHFDQTNGKLKLWDKQDEKAAGNASPNDADADVLAWSHTDIYEFIDVGQKARKVEKPRVPAELLGTDKLVTELQRLITEGSSSAEVNMPLATVEQGRYDALAEQLRALDLTGLKQKPTNDLMSTLYKIYG